ncbi:response regulator transcription factor [Candidatus Uabimicrobium amorphum]|uniref:DNA-binding response regulator n=1 Tax=Uabimicrobium amorphum TaxID=2596890 RepID=A0A5S9F4I1_UABAM|nr:response regulator transcription factor [Candidatus Uabimicrobium amorphum]BBM84252.1 DNA-binding response regulator [Candidatus Uabimicrobium amorphum]
MRILLVEDEEGVIRFITKGLSEEGFTVDSCPTAESALQQIETQKYDLLILDISLPKMNGFQFLSIFRKKEKLVPVLVLTAKDTLNDKKQGFELQCDDYLTKPFHFEELLMRIRALLRRHIKESKVVEIGNLRLDIGSFKVFIDDRPVSLTKKEFALLRYFMANEGHVISRTQILNHVWQEPYNIGSNVVDATVKSLRKKIYIQGNSFKISSVYGIGYILQDEQSL